MSNYFDEQIATGKPIVPPTVAQAPSIVNKEATPSNNTVNDPIKEAELAVEKAKATLEQAKKAKTKDSLGLAVRGSGDNVYLLGKGKKRWVTTAEVYANLGFKFGDEVKLDDETLAVIPEGEPIR